MGQTCGAKRRALPAIKTADISDCIRVSRGQKVCRQTTQARPDGFRDSGRATCSQKVGVVDIDPLPEQLAGLPASGRTLEHLPGMPFHMDCTRRGMPRRRVEQRFTFKVVDEPLPLLTASDVVRRDPN